LVEECRLRTEEALHDESLVSESTDMEHLPMKLKMLAAAHTYIAQAYYPY
jgi:hypothetical protein